MQLGKSRLNNTKAGLSLLGRAAKCLEPGGMLARSYSAGPGVKRERRELFRDRQSARAIATLASWLAQRRTTTWRRRVLDFRASPKDEPR